jgi:uncharacterized membrane protein YhaH (DUF805 family)
MGFGEAVRTCFNKYVTFSGRARRSEYWWWALFIIIGQAVFGVIDRMLFGAQVVQMGDMMVEAQTGPLGGLFGLVTLLPGISVMVRRLHDTGHSGWWFWINLIPIVGWIIFLYWMIKAGDAGDNAFGSDPLAGGAGYGASSVPRVPR